LRAIYVEIEEYFILGAICRFFGHVLGLLPTERLVLVVDGTPGDRKGPGSYYGFRPFSCPYSPKRLERFSVVEQRCRCCYRLLLSYLLAGPVVPGPSPVEPGEGRSAQAVDDYGGAYDEAPDYPCFFYPRLAVREVGVEESRYPYRSKPSQKEGIPRSPCPSEQGASARRPPVSRPAWRRSDPQRISSNAGRRRRWLSPARAGSPGCRRPWWRAAEEAALLEGYQRKSSLPGDHREQLATFVAVK
jgi:hypothetical protein